MKKTYFISGHRLISPENFEKYYIKKLENIIKNEPESVFVLAEYEGVDRLAQDWLSKNLDDLTRVTVYHMYDKPRYLASNKFNTVGGFKSDIERDAAMTENSDEDIAFIKPGKWTSGTAQNILRRYEKLID